MTRVSGGPGRQTAYLASSACSQGEQRNQGARPDQRIQETLSGNWVFHRKSMLRARKNAQNWQRLTKIASCRQAKEARAGVQASRVSADRRTQELPPTLTSSHHPGFPGLRLPLAVGDRPRTSSDLLGPVSGCGHCWGPRGNVWGPGAPDVHCGSVGLLWARLLMEAAL